MLINNGSNSAELIATAESLFQKLQMEIDRDADALQKAFYEEKEILYNEELDRLKGELGDPHKALKRAYAPLNFHARTEDDRLEIYWWLRHRRPTVGDAKGAVIRRRLPWGAAKTKDRKGYYLPNLLCHAKKWEAQLVKQVEAHAVTLRERRAALIEMQNRLAVYRRLLNRDYAVPKEVAPKVADSTLTDSAEHPLVAPAPPRRSNPIVAEGENGG